MRKKRFYAHQLRRAGTGNRHRLSRLIADNFRLSKMIAFEECSEVCDIRDPALTKASDDIVGNLIERVFCF